MGATKPDTLVKFLVRNTLERGSKVAWRKKHFGIWREYTWEEVCEKVKYCALGFADLGLCRDDCIAVLGDNDPEWFWSELGAQALGARVAGMFSEGLPNEVKYIAEHSDSKIVVAQDQEQVDKLLQIAEELPLLKKVIYWDPKGVKHYTDPILMSFDELLERGKAFEEKSPRFFEEEAAAGKGEELAVIMYTSGTSGAPKGAMITNAQLVKWADRCLSLIPVFEGDDYLSFTLPGWIVEQMMGLAGSVIAGQRINFPEERETVQENIVEISPHHMLLPPPLWINISSLMQVGISDTTPVKRLLYKLFLPIGYKVADIRLAGGRPNLFWKFMYMVSNLVVFRAIKSRHGLHRVRRPCTAGSLLGPDIYRFFHAIGVRLKNVYGITETGLISGQKDDQPRADTVGSPISDVVVKISDAGEILVGKDSCFEGYYKNPEATEKTFTENWYHTGDAGVINDDGNLIFIDRLADLKQLKDGTKFSPQFIESSLKFSPYIQEAIVIDDPTGEYIVTIINIDFRNVANWAEKKRIPYTTFVDLSQREEVLDLVAKEIERVNVNLPPTAKIKKYISLHKEFDPDEAELTRTKKLRRGHMENRYAEMTDAMFAGKEDIVVKTPVVYQDGREAIITARVKINTVA
ncbi:MAG: AMP-binding protein [Desulfatiglans sp.]|nr:AMP-binding protein [Desulfatiglans sp.]